MNFIRRLRVGKCDNEVNTSFAFTFHCLEGSNKVKRLEVDDAYGTLSQECVKI